MQKQLNKRGLSRDEDEEMARKKAKIEGIWKYYIAKDDRANAPTKSPFAFNSNEVIKIHIGISLINV